MLAGACQYQSDLATSAGYPSTDEVRTPQKPNLIDSLKARADRQIEVLGRLDNVDAVGGFRSLRLGSSLSDYSHEGWRLTVDREAPHILQLKRDVPGSIAVGEASLSDVELTYSDSSLVKICVSRKGSELDKAIVGVLRDVFGSPNVVNTVTPYQRPRPQGKLSQAALDALQGRAPPPPATPQEKQEEARLWKNMISEAAKREKELVQRPEIVETATWRTQATEVTYEFRSRHVWKKQMEEAIPPFDSRTEKKEVEAVCYSDLNGVRSMEQKSADLEAAQEAEKRLQEENARRRAVGDI